MKSGAPLILGGLIVYYERNIPIATIVAWHVHPKNAHEARSVITIAEQYPGPMPLILYSVGKRTQFNVSLCAEVFERLLLVFGEETLELEYHVWTAPAHH